MPDSPAHPAVLSNVTVRESQGRLELDYRWWHRMHAMNLSVAVIWALVGFGLCYYNVEVGARSPGDMLLSAVFVALISSGLAYVALAGLLNTTLIRVENGRFSIRHSPLPWRGARELPVGQISQFYVQEKRGSKGARSYSLCLELANRTKVRLLSGRLSDQDLLRIEETLEKHLGITDRAMAEEYS